MTEETVARELLASARSLVDARIGGHPRAVAARRGAAGRQALEVALKTYWSAKAAGPRSVRRARSSCASAPTWRRRALARRAHQVWSALSRASHHHPYELTPTHEELVAWCETVHEVVEMTERAWR